MNSKRRVMSWMLVLLTMAGLWVPTLAGQAAPAPSASNLAQKAGSITALLPTAKIVRGAGRKAVTTEAKKGDGVFWSDTLRTDKGGRARVTLNDQSILSLGSQAELRIVKHDARTQQTALELGYGRLRAEVSTVTRQGGEFTLRTPTAVAGVIGTDFGTTSTIGSTVFLCISGTVSIRNANTNVPGTVPCEAGYAVTVTLTGAPTKRKATLAEIKQFIEETEPALINGLNPAGAIAGSQLDVLASGLHMNHIGSIDSPDGLSVTMTGTPTESAAKLNVTVAADAKPGPRVIGFKNKGGDGSIVVTSEAVFTVLGPNDTLGGPLNGLRFDNKEKTVELGAEAYFDAPALTGNATSVEWDLCEQGYKPVSMGSPTNLSDSKCRPMTDLTSTEADFTVPTCNLVAGDYPVRLVLNNSTAYETILHVLAPTYDNPKARLQDLAATYSNLRPDLFMGFFDSANYTAYPVLSDNIRNSMNLLSSANVLVQVMSSNTTCNENNMRATWQSNYTYKGSTVLLHQTTEYLTVKMLRTPGRGWYITDFLGDNGNLLSGPPGPQDNSEAALPDFTILNSGYMVDGEYFSGPNQSVSQGPVTFGATLSNVGDVPGATSIKVQFTLTGTGVSLTNTVLVPGPLAKDSTQLVTTNFVIPSTVAPGTALTLTVLANSDNGVQEKISTNNLLTSGILVGTIDLTVVSMKPIFFASVGNSTGSLVIQNNGTGNYGGGSQNLVISGADFGSSQTKLDIPPIASNQSVTIPFTYVVPNVAGVHPLTATITPLPSGDPHPNDKSLTINVNVQQAYDLALSNLTLSSPLIGGYGTISGSVSIYNGGVLNFPGAANNLKLSSDFGGFALLSAIPPIGADSTVTVNFSGVLPSVTATAIHPFTMAITPYISGDTTTAAHSIVVSSNVVEATVDLKLLSLAVSKPPYLSGQSQSITFQVQNNGTVPSAATDTYSCTMLRNGTGTPTTLGSGTLASIASAATSATITVNYAVPVNFYGNNTIVCSLSQDALEKSSTMTDNTGSIAAAVSANINLRIGSPSTIPNADQMGQVGTITINVVNSGLDDAPAGWDVVFQVNGTTIGSALGPALAAGANTNVVVPFTMITQGTPPQDITVGGAVTIDANSAVPDTNPVDNVFSFTNLRLVDFLVTPTVASLRGVTGRSFTVASLASIQPSTYPLPFTLTYANVPAGLTTTAAIPGSFGGAPTTAGTFNVTLTGNGGGVTHPGGSIPITIFNEISVTPVGAPPNIITGAAPVAITVNVTGGATNVRLTAQLPVGVSTTSPLTQTPTGGVVTWMVSADVTSLAGSSLTFPIQVQDDGFPESNTPAANFTVNYGYALTGVANYQVTAVTVAGHTAPYNGANAFQSGEVIVFTATVSNVGNGTTAGTVVLQANCGNPTYCNGTLPSGSGSAPAVGTPSTITITVPLSGLPPGTYPGTISIQSAPSQTTTADDSFSLPFDVMSFNLAFGTPIFAIQNIPVAGSGQIPVQLTATGTSTPPAIPLTLTAGVANVTFTAINPMPANSSQPITVNVAGSVAPNVNDTITINGSNHGVAGTAITQAVHYYTSSVSNTTLTVNDAGTPIKLPIYPTGVTPVPQKMLMQWNGNYDTSLGTLAQVSATAPAGVVTNLAGPLSLNPGDTFELDIYATTGATSVVGKVTLSVSIPATNPPTSTTFDIYVLPQPSVDLAVTATVPVDTFTSSTPWLVGQSSSVNVTVKNNGTASSVGGDKLVVAVNGLPAGSATVPVLAGGASTGVNVPVNLPDSSWPATSYLTATVYPIGSDANPSNNYGVSVPVNTSNWKLIVVGGAGSGSGEGANALPLTINTSVLSASVALQVLNQDGTVNTGAIFSPTAAISIGSKAQGFGATPSPSSISGSTPSSLTISYPTVSGISLGGYYVQAIATLGSVQRQATVHIAVNNTNPAHPIALSGFFAPDGNSNFTALAPASPGTNVQINGPVAEQVSLTLTCTDVVSCGQGHSPRADMNFNEPTSMEVIDPATATLATPVQLPLINNVAMSTPQVVGLMPIQNYDGSLNASSVIIAVSLTNLSSPNVPRMPSADPVGSNVYNLGVNIGDVDVSTPGNCIVLPPGQNYNASITFVPVNGFNAPLSIAWLDAGGNPIPSTELVIAGPASASPSGGVYAPFGVTFTTPAGTTGGLTSVLMAVTMNSRSIAGVHTTKFFPMTFDLSPNGQYCLTYNAPGNRRADGGIMAKAGAVGGRTLIKGFYGKNNIVATSRNIKAPSDGNLADVQVASADITAAPSVPKSGDAVEVRFKLRNMGAAIKGVPVALQVNGATVARDTFDVPANGSALAALHWDTAATAATWQAALKPTAPVQPAGTQGNRRAAPDGPAAPAMRSALNTMRLSVAIDPDHLTKQASTVNKSAAVAGFKMLDASAPAATSASSGQRVMLELGEGVCIGLRFASGPSHNCAGTEAVVQVDDLGAGRYSITSDEGVADLGVGNANVASANFSSRAAAISGHSYAVKMQGGQVGILTLNSISNRMQLAVQSQRVFSKLGAGKVVQTMGSTSQPAGTGEVSGGALRDVPKVYIDLGYRVQ